LKNLNSSLFLFLFILCGCSFLSDGNEISLTKNLNSNVTEETKTIEITPSMVKSGQLATSTPEINRTINDAYNIVHLGPGTVNVPILLYHHVLEGKATNQYSVSFRDFQEQLSYLKDNEYHTISLLQLVQAITVGADLPEKSVILTFDDGNENVYLNAFPLMKNYGFTGVVYIIANRINAEGFLSVEQIKELLSSGWEIGSHGMNHVDLVKNPQALRDEIGTSKKKIEDSLEIKVTSFAYPYGEALNLTKDWVKQIGYLAGMGLGITNRHNKNNLFYLDRRQVESDMDMSDFVKLLAFD